MMYSSMMMRSRTLFRLLKNDDLQAEQPVAPVPVQEETMHSDTFDSCPKSLAAATTACHDSSDFCYSCSHGP